ncbi:hypothetical protein EOL96_02455 [Candidatus Saccharibacteria bacterium]|nr:hypothetical protein [Candidatus Saccharibacteria bacterium]
MVNKTSRPRTKVAPKKSVNKTSAPKKRKTVATTPAKVDYYPNRMTVAISALAGTLLVLLALIAVLGAQ